MKKIQDETVHFKQCMSVKNKQEAMYALKRIKRFEKNLTATRAQKDTIINQMDAIREATSQQEQLKAEQIGMAQLSKQQKKLNSDEIHEMKEDMNDLLDEQNEIQNALSKEIGDPTPDEDDLNEYLASLVDEPPKQTFQPTITKANNDELEEFIADLENVQSNLPNLPNTPLPSTSKNKVAQRNDASLQELQAWAN